MADDEQLTILRQGVDAWNNWRRANPSIEVNLVSANLGDANLGGANLMEAKLRRTYLVGANLGEAYLGGAILERAKLIGANLEGANLVQAYLSEAYLESAKLRGAVLAETILNNVDLSTTKGLNDCQHMEPSCVDHRTITRSKNVPISFWRGCGLPDALIDYIPSLAGGGIQFYSCFISYSSRDQEFADRLYADLQNVGVRCWFASHDLEIGAKTWDGIDKAIRTRDKVLLILSEGAIDSDWVEDEVTKAFAEERRRSELVLFPVRLDDAVMQTDEPWAGKLRDNRNIGDFTLWKDHGAYKTTFDRVLRDLKTKR